MKILITGGAGFIGSHVAIRCVQDGHEVVLLDNFHSYYDKTRKYRQLERVRERYNVLFYECDILHKEALHDIMEKERVDAVIHLAGLPGVQLSLRDPGMYVDINVKGTAHVLECAGKTGVKHIVFGSSSSVYGEQTGVPLTEHMANGQVLSPYAASKFGAESLCHAYRYMYGYDVHILRFFTVYGPWGRPDMAIGGFLRRLQRKEPLHIYGTGTGRDYTYIDDLVEGIVLTLQAKGSDTYNIGSDAPVLMETLLQQLRLYYPDMKVILQENRMGDVTSTWADITKATTQLGYTPQVSFAEGLRRTVLWAKAHEDLL